MRAAYGGNLGGALPAARLTPGAGTRPHPLEQALLSMQVCSAG